MSDKIDTFQNKTKRERQIGIQGIKLCLLALSDECKSYNLKELADMVQRTAEQVPERDNN